MATRKYHKSNKRFRKTRSKRQRGGNQEEKDKYLFDAIYMDDAVKVENALNNGADVNATDDDGDTALMKIINCDKIDDRPWSNVEHDITKVVNMLLAAGVDVNVKNIYGKTALEIAAETNCTEKIQLPLKQLIQRNREKQTLTNIAIEQKYTKPSAKRQVLGQAVRDSKGKVDGLTGTTGTIFSFLGGKRRSNRRSKRRSKRKTQKSKRSKKSQRKTKRKTRT